MTNIKKYLKKDVDVEELKKDFFDYLVSDGVYGCNSKNIAQKWEDFLNMPATPTLTEDERVILRNIDKNIYSKIGFTGLELYLVEKETGNKDRSFEAIFGRDSLFQFIKERRRIRDRRTFERRIIMGQRLNVEIVKGDKVLANAYYHWSGFSHSAIHLTREIIERL